MEITENMRKTAHGLADSVKDTVNALEQGAKDGARIDTSKGSLIEELSKINNYFNDSKQSKANDDFVKDVILFAQLQVEAAKRFFDNSGNEATKILEQSQYWNSAKPYFYVIAINYIGYIADNYQAFVNMLKVTKESCPEYIDEMLKELIEAAKNDLRPISDIKLTHFLAMYATITDTCKFKGLEPTENNLLGLNAELADVVTKKSNEVLPKYDLEPIDKVKYFTDRVNHDLVKNISDALEKGGYTIIKSADSKKDDSIFLNVEVGEYGSLDDALKAYNLDKVFSEYDKLVFMFVVSLLLAGNWRFSASYLYRLISGGKSPSTGDIKRLVASMEKMSLMKIAISNEVESKTTGYKRFVTKTEYFLNCSTELETVYFGNMHSSCWFHVRQMPPLAKFAETRNFAGIDLSVETMASLRRLKYNMTEINAGVLGYIINRTAEANNGLENSDSILYKSLFDKCDMNTPMQRKRGLQKAETVLKAFKETNIIAGYTVNEDRFKITPKNAIKPITKTESTKPHRKG